MKMDMFAGEPQFVDHLSAIWHALPDAERGQFIVLPGLQERALRRGVQATLQATDPTRPILTASYGDIKKVRRIGRTSIAFIEHGIGQSYAGDRKSATHASYAGGTDRGDVGLFLVPNETSAARWRNAYPRASTEVVGCPKLDRLPRRDGGAGPQPVVAVSFHFDCSVSPETRSTFSFYRKTLPDLAAQFTIIGHAHPRAFRQLSRRYARYGIEPIEDFEDICRRADLYVCDNSSTLYEFAATGRPVVVLNGTYRKHINHGLRFWEASGVGVEVDEPADLLPAVERALLDAEEQQWAREAALRIVYTHRTGAAERAVDALRSWADSSMVVAA